MSRNGGSDTLIAPSKEVNIHTDDGVVKAVFGWPAIHMRKEERRGSEHRKIYSWIVAVHQKEEVEALGIHVGCVATFRDGYDSQQKQICWSCDRQQNTLGL